MKPTPPAPPPDAAHDRATVWTALQPHRGAFLLSFALVAVNRAAALVLPLTVAVLLDRVLRPKNLTLLPALVAAVLAATAVQAATGYALGIVLGSAAERVLTSTRIRVQRHVLSLPMRFFDRQVGPGLANRIMKDVGGLRDLLGPAAVQSMSTLMTGLFVLAGLLYLSVRLTLPLLALLAIIAFGLRWSGRNLQPYYAAVSDLESRISGRLGESFGGVRVVKAYAAEPREARFFARHLLALAESTIGTATAQGRISSVATLVFTLVSAGIAWLGTRQIAAGHLTPGRLVAYFALLAYAVAGARQLGMLRVQFASASAALNRTRALLREQPEEADPARKLAPRLQGTVIVENVDFAYAPGLPVLHGISFTARPGTLTALVGASGAGKSTLAALLCGFYTASSGSITIDGANLANLRLGPYREQLGLVLQHPFLFGGTVRENLLFARPGATEAEMLECCRMAHVDGFVARLPQGYETLLGERGIRLSGGEQQRLCMARALLRDPQLLLLDEPTSSLDAESEAYVQQSLDRLIPERTTVVIAHRLSTIRRAHQILVLESGRIVERGTHKSLLDQRGAYFRLYQRQSTPS